MALITERVQIHARLGGCLEISMALPQQIRAILDVFEHFELTPYDFLHSLLLTVGVTDTFKDHWHSVTKSFQVSAHVELCLEAFRVSTLTADNTSKWVFQFARQGYMISHEFWRWTHRSFLPKWM